MWEVVPPEQVVYANTGAQLDPHFVLLEHRAEERLKEIKRLLDQGLISQEEYEKKRGEILKGL